MDTRPENVRGSRNVMSAGTLAGDDVYNRDEEHIGTVKEIMLDLTAGKVAYVVLSTGGFLGLGDKLFAIPWQAFEIDEANHRFILNVDKQKLENAPGFDKDDWPDLSSEEYGTQVRDYYGFAQ